MAANEYYQQPPPSINYYDDGGDVDRTGRDNGRHHPLPPLATPSPAPSSAYSSVYPHGQPQRVDTVSPPYLASGAPHRADTVSPFDTVFDDHVYPVDSPSGSRRGPGAPPAFAHDADTSYHGLNRVPSDDTSYARQYQGHPSYGGDNYPPSPADGIPLNSLSHKDVEAPDHVYDGADHGGVGPPERPKKKGIRSGELGMFGANRRRIPWVTYLLTTVQIAVFIGEIVKNSTTTGSPIMTQPQFNPMIGPSPYVLINMGARWQPCMHNVDGIQNFKGKKPTWPCPNTTSADSSTWTCTLSDLCGFGGVAEPTGEGINQQPQPNQWFRFIVPIFMHAGLIHIGFNMLLQLTLGKDMERAVGSIRYFLVYICAGIFGFVLGGNYAGAGSPSTGASGSLFGIIALTLLDLLYSWKERRSPVRDLLFIMLDVVISFVLGLLPGLDNFSHIGGFLMGLGLGICVLHSPNSLRRRIGGDDAAYASVTGPRPAPVSPTFFRNPMGFFKGRKPLWWAWWLIRVGALITVTVVFIVLLNNFYKYHDTCDWCKYLSCIPVKNWCDLDKLQFQSSTSASDGQR